MDVGIIASPYKLPESNSDAASLHIGHMISILKSECSIDKVEYADFTSAPHYLFSRLLRKLCENPKAIGLPDFLFNEELIDLVKRFTLEEVFDVPAKRRTCNFFQVPESFVEGTTQILLKIAGKMVSTVSPSSKDAILIVSLYSDITYTLHLLRLVREEDPDVPVIVLDHYTFEPSTPYLESFLTGKDYYGDNVGKPLEYDPLFPYLKTAIPEFIDWLVVGEGYDVLRTLFKSNALEKNYCLEGVSTAGKGTVHALTIDSRSSINRTGETNIIRSKPVDLDTLPFPDYSLIKGKYASGEIEFARGCPYSCIFCERSGLFGQKVRWHSYEYIRELVDHLLSRYKFKFYTVLDPSVNMNEKLMVRYLQNLEKDGIYFPYQANLRGKRTTEELFRLLRNTGCKEIAVGLESGDNEVLKSMHKAETVNVAKKLVRSIGENNMKSMLFLIMGFPTERIESIRRSIEVLRSIQPRSSIDLILIEFYHAGHLQRLKPSVYDTYGIRWSDDLRIRNIKQSSRIYAAPGLFGVADFTMGMRREELHMAARAYIRSIKEMGLKCTINYNA